MINNEHKFHNVFKLRIPKPSRINNGTHVLAYASARNRIQRIFVHKMTRPRNDTNCVRLNNETSLKATNNASLIETNILINGIIDSLPHAID